MRLFVLITSAVFVAIGIDAIASGRADAYSMTGFFGFCFLVALIEPWLPKPWLESEFSVLIGADEITCLFRRRPRETVRWADVIRVWYVTTSHGPHSPDEWIVLEAEASGCSFPTEAKNFKAIWPELERRFPGFDFAPIIEGGTTDAKHLCWERDRRTASGA